MNMDKDLQYTIRTQEMEGRKPSATAIHLCRKLSTGAISAEDAVHQIKILYGLQGVPRHD